MTTPRMALVPVEATEEMYAVLSDGDIATSMSYSMMLAASPDGGRVSRDQLLAATWAVYDRVNASASMKVAIARAVIEAIGLEVE